MNPPLISVIIPVYKVEKFLPKCLDSVLAQTYKNLEIILVDDGSPDNCGKICDQYAQKDSRIQVIHQTNQGLAGARNSGLKIAQGDYVGFVDSDDYMEPDTYEYLLRLITQDNAAMAMCNICEDEGFHSAKPLTQPYTVIAFQQIFESPDWMFAWNKLYRKNFIGQVRFNTTTSYGEDIFFNFELAKTNAPVALGNQAKFHYRKYQNPNALTSIFQPAHVNKIILEDQCLAYAKEHHGILIVKPVLLRK